MTIELETLSNGIIDAGYYSACTGAVRMGDCWIRTEDFCMLVARLACGEAHVRVPTRDGGFTEGSWNPQAKIVQLGQYQIAGSTFGAFADYVLNGGLFGWDFRRPEFKPEFVKNAIEYVHDHAGNQPADSYLNTARQEAFADLETKLLPDAAELD